MPFIAIIEETSIAIATNPETLNITTRGSITDSEAILYRILSTQYIVYLKSKEFDFAK